MAPTHSVFGFTVESLIPFRFLRAGQGDLILRVTEAPSAAMAQAGPPVFEWTYKDASGEVSARLYHCDGVYHFWTADVGWYRIDPRERTITIPREADAERRELRLWGVPTMLCSIERGDIPLHASAVEVAGGAVLFAAPGRFGKTTLALAFHTHGYRVLSEDVACCRLTPKPFLFPGPASLRVRPDVYDGTVPPGTEIVSVKADRAFLRLDPDRSGSADPVPIRAIVFLRPSDGDVRLERVEPVRALPDLWALNFRMRGDAAAARSFEGLSRLAASTTVWNLHRPLRIDVLPDVVACIADAPFVSSG